jgi:hypothetical protein
MDWMTGVHFLAGAVVGIFLFTTVSSLALEPAQAPTQCVLGQGQGMKGQG